LTKENSRLTHSLKPEKEAGPQRGKATEARREGTKSRGLSWTQGEKRAAHRGREIMVQTKKNGITPGIPTERGRPPNRQTKKEKKNFFGANDESGVVA